VVLLVPDVISMQYSDESLSLKNSKKAVSWGVGLPLADLFTLASSDFSLSERILKSSGEFTFSWVNTLSLESRWLSDWLLPKRRSDKGDEKERL